MSAAHPSSLLTINPSTCESALNGSWTEKSQAIYYLLDQDADMFNTDGEILNHADFVSALQGSLSTLIVAGEVTSDTTLTVDTSMTDFTFLDDGSRSSDIPAMVLETNTNSILESIGFKWVYDLYGEYNVYGRLDDKHSVGGENPCPSGFRVPTKIQWEGVLDNNIQSIVGTWASYPGDPVNYSAAFFLGNGLLLPAAGYRSSNSGALYSRGYYGGYWSSSENSSSDAWNLYFFGSGNADTSYNYRRFGFSVRCISE